MKFPVKRGSTSQVCPSYQFLTQGLFGHKHFSMELEEASLIWFLILEYKNSHQEDHALHGIEHMGGHDGKGQNNYFSGKMLSLPPKVGSRGNIFLFRGKDYSNISLANSMCWIFSLNQ